MGYGLIKDVCFAVGFLGIIISGFLTFISILTTGIMMGNAEPNSAVVDMGLFTFVAIIVVFLSMILLGGLINERTNQRRYLYPPSKSWFVRYPDGNRSVLMSYGNAFEYKEIFKGKLERG